MRRLGHGLPLQESTDRISPPRTTEDGREVRPGLFTFGGDILPRVQAARLENEHRQWQIDARELRRQREERTAAASLNRLAGGLESEARHHRIEMNDERRARIAERTAGAIRRGYAIRDSPYFRTTCEANEFQSARDEELRRRAAMEQRQNTGRTADGPRAAFNPLEAQERRPDWERSREERRREGHEASTVRNREGFLEQPMLGAPPNMLTDQKRISICA